MGHRLVELGLPLGLMEALLDGLQVGEGQLDLDHAEVLEWIGGPGDVVVDERSEHEDDRVDLADVGEELVAETFALAGALDQAADVDHFHGGVDRLLRLRHHREAVEPIVGHLRHPDVRVLRGERVRRSERATAGQCVVQRALARVGETDESETFHEAPEATEAILPSVRIQSHDPQPDPRRPAIAGGEIRRRRTIGRPPCGFVRLWPSDVSSPLDR